MTNTLSAILSDLTGPVALFVDFDGTLVEIAPSPDAVRVPDWLVGRLDGLHERLGGAFAIVSGRMIADIDGFLSPSRYSVAGGHGAEERHGETQSDPSEESRAGARAIARHATRALGEDDRILVEPKASGVAVHFRAAPEREAEVRETLAEAVAAVPGFHLMEGKMVVEARTAGTDKGAAIRRLMTRAPFSGRLPVFIGDDVTDEDGFEAVAELGGFGVKIGPGPTLARHRLPDVAAGLDLITAIAEGRHEAPATAQRQEANAS